MYRSVTVPTIYLIRAEYDASRSRKFSHLPPVLLEWMVPDFSILEFSWLRIFRPGIFWLGNFCREILFHETQPTPTVPLSRSALVWHLQGTYLIVATIRTAFVQLAYRRRMQQIIQKIFRSHLVLNQLMTSFYVFLKLTRDYRERKAEERRFKIEKQPG